MADSQLNQFPFSTPIDLQSLIYAQRSIGGGNFVDEKITPQMILNEATSGGGLTPEVITTDQTAVSGKLYLNSNSVTLTTPSTLIPGVTRFAITNPVVNQNFAVLPSSGHTIRLRNAIATDVNVIEALGTASYCEILAISTTSMICIIGVEVEIHAYSGGPN